MTTVQGQYIAQDQALLQRIRDGPQPDVDVDLRKRFKAMPLSFPAGLFLLQSGNINTAPSRQPWPNEPAPLPDETCVIEALIQETDYADLLFSFDSYDSLDSDPLTIDCFNDPAPSYHPSQFFDDFPPDLVSALNHPHTSFDSLSSLDSLASYDSISPLRCHASFQSCLDSFPTSHPADLDVKSLLELVASKPAPSRPSHKRPRHDSSSDTDTCYSPHNTTPLKTAKHNSPQTHTPRRAAHPPQKFSSFHHPSPRRVPQPQTLYPPNPQNPPHDEPECPHACAQTCATNSHQLSQRELNAALSRFPNKSTT